MIRHAKAALVAGVAGAVVPLLSIAPAHAEDSTVYFAMNSGSFQCSIAADGTVGCDTSPKQMSMKIAGITVPMLIPVHAVVIDVGWAPAHPGFDSGTPHTLPGGNPNLSDVATGHGQWGPSISYAGATCEGGFHGSISCRSKGHSFSYYEIIAAD